MTEPCPDWVDPEPFRTHLRSLICQTGLPWRVIAAHAGISPRAVRALLHGRRSGPVRRLHVSVARAIAATTAEAIAGADDEPTDNRPVRQLLHDIRHLGYRDEDLLQTHLTIDDLHQLDNTHLWLCSRATAARVSACYDVLTQTPTRDHRVNRSRPHPQHVVCGQQHPRLDRKQTTWPTDSSSPASARSS